MGIQETLRGRGSRIWTPVLGVMTVAVMAACGGGGDSGSNGGSNGGGSQPAATVQGTAASGAFMGGAQVTMFDADGKTVGIRVADANGRYSFDVSGFRAPFALQATGTAGGETVTYVSVLPTKPASGSTVTANVTPLTTALAALLAGGNPADLTGASALNSKVSSAGVQQATAALRAVLANVATSAGMNAGSFDPISTPLTTEGQGADAVIDLVHVTLTANGVKLASRGAQLTGGSIPEAVLDANALTKPPAALPTPTASTNARTFEAIRANLQACFAAAPSARASATALLTACAPAFASDYLNNSYSAAVDFSALFSSTDMNGAVFRAPIVLFNGKADSGEATAFVRFPFVRADGSTSQFTRRVTNRAGTWTMTGNQRQYEAAVTRRISKVIERNTGAGIASRYETSLRVLLNPQTGLGIKAQLVRVTGPGLPSAGVVLARSRVCGSSANLVIQNLNGSLTYAANDPVAPNAVISSSGQSSSTVVLAATPLKAGDALTWSSLSSGANTYASAPLSDNDITAIPTFASYTFDVWYLNNDLSYKTALPATPDDSFTVTSSGGVLMPSVIARQTWNEIAEGSLDFVTTGGGKTGAQTTVDVNWTQNAEPVDRALAFGRQFAAAVAPAPAAGDRTFIQTNVPSYLQRSVTVSTAKQGSSAFVSCNGATFPAFASAGDQRTVEIRSTTGDDTQKFVRVVGTYR
ncbi:hypothetical protein [Cupriavidus metallidurans]|uniref:Carboxypeptidase regulatory-like domain-containing protein n=1 Tax=Cupriavidus metallidurans (strain ATCC 43123 / DSM 2839 / NBRC 102507 / CH34) TaxID=266264 RepID=Q1LNJ1_CUPMC|nr:hypothetical protein [Cupriavidus metallidurans]ABF08285.1 conserved hypothetical protein [Cupriavidus metallidurans CH34]QGS30734.1 hypothetical protein FOB83_18680 [Cupriavidus metallidurans]